MSSIQASSMKDAQSIIDALKDIGDYQSCQKDIAQTLLIDLRYNGHWDNVYDPPETSSLPSFRLIEENEYDQYCDNPKLDMPAWDEMIGSTNMGYLFRA